MTGDVLRNKKGEEVRDMRGEVLHYGQAVLMMDTCWSKGGRGSVSTGWVVGYDRYVQVVSNSGDVSDFVKLYQDKLSGEIPKSVTLRAAAEDRGLKRWSGESISSPYLIGCTDLFLRGWRDGSIFK
ncbi:hypothetical protein Arno18_124 [Pectobacterium phage Arno18]|uniref:Uncharacterized protein n=1 Tax=Pectobacterium phage Arno18 TaxID=2500578 RepID=A0A678ZSW0_9CAUD|nr:hypothetical protein Arno18_124 [Pectobacterium phage Arno18]